MNPQLTTTFCFPKWWWFALLSFLIFSPGAPTSSIHQKVPVQTEQRDEARSVKTLFHFVDFHQPASQNNFLSERRFFLSLLQYSNSIKVCFENRDDSALLFTPIGITLIADFLPRSNEESFFLNQR